MVYVMTANVPRIILQKSARRINVIIQNVGLTSCLLRVDAPPEDTAFDFALSADTGLREGNGGAVTIEGNQGTIWAVAEGGNSQIAVLETDG